MAIQNRRGAYEDFDPLKLLPGEYAVVQEGDPDGADGYALYLCYRSGIVKRLVSADDLDAALNSFSVEWDDIENVPSTFPTTWAQVGNKPATFPTMWTQVENRPSIDTTLNVTGAIPDSKVVGTNLNTKAPKDSPAFTGTPTAPTPASGDSSTKIATTEFVSGAVSGLSSDWADITNKPKIDKGNSGTDSIQESAGTATGGNAHAEGMATASGSSSHAEGSGRASGNFSHAEGASTKATAQYAHAEGYMSEATADAAHAEGHSTEASAIQAHAEGRETLAYGRYSHAEGFHTEAGNYQSHSEGSYTRATGLQAHAEGKYTEANHASQHVFGEYNVLDTSEASANDRGNYVEIVGNGTADNARSNARTLDWNGNEVIAGKLTVGASPTADMDVATKQYVDNHSSAPTVSGTKLVFT